MSEEGLEYSRPAPYSLNTSLKAKHDGRRSRGPYTSRVIELVLAAYVTMSVLAFAVYAADKRRAARGQWRISEATLHTIELLGGWPGAIAAQHLMHHKRRKAGYMRVFWLIVTIHGIAWWWVGRSIRQW
jgi:uncharacterized membrane protein YsdA (DUF1294 family)